MHDQPLPIPPRFREQAFRFYEHTIARIINTFPQVLIIDARKEYELSPVTFANRLRDAMTSHTKYAWQSAYVDVEKLRALWPSQIVVSERDDGLIAIGSKETLREVIVRSANPLAGGDIELDYTDDPKAVEAAIELCHRRKLIGLQFVVSNFTDFNVQDWESKRDVAFSPTPGRENTYYLT